MSLTETSSRTNEVHYVNVEIIAPENGGWDRGTRTITYHSKPVSSTSFDFDLSPDDNGDLSLSFSSTVTTGFDMEATDVLDVEHPYDPDSEFMAIELIRTEKNTRTVKESERTTATTTLTINLADPESSETDGDTTAETSNDETDTDETTTATDQSSQSDEDSTSPISFEQTFSVTASGSDISKEDITWHIYEQQEDGGDPENGGGGVSMVYLYDINDVHEESTTYNYSNNSEDGPSGTLVKTTTVSYQYVDEDGAITTHNTSTTTELDLTENQPEPPSELSVDEPSNEQEEPEHLNAPQPEHQVAHGEAVDSGQANNESDEVYKDYWGGGWNPINWLYGTTYKVSRPAFDMWCGNYRANIEINGKRNDLEARLQIQDDVNSTELLAALRAQNQKPVGEAFNHLIQEVELAAAGSYGAAFSYARSAAQGFGNMQCRQCVKAVTSKLKAKNVNGYHVIKLKSRKGQYIWSNRLGKKISEDGTHEAVMIGCHIFDNLNPDGIPFLKWYNDLDAPLGFDIELVAY